MNGHITCGIRQQVPSIASFCEDADHGNQNFAWGGYVAIAAQSNETCLRICLNMAFGRNFENARRLLNIGAQPGVAVAFA